MELYTVDCTNQMGIIRQPNGRLDYIYIIGGLPWNATLPSEITLPLKLEDLKHLSMLSTYRCRYDEIMLYFHILLDQPRFESNMKQTLEKCKKLGYVKYKLDRDNIVGLTFGVEKTQEWNIPYGPRIISRLHDSIANGIDLEEFYKSRMYIEYRVNEKNIEFYMDYASDASDYYYSRIRVDQKEFWILHTMQVIITIRKWSPTPNEVIYEAWGDLFIF